MAAIWEFIVLTLQILYNVPLINIKLELLNFEIMCFYKVNMDLLFLM